jgi:hypothetical protein
MYVDQTPSQISYRSVYHDEHGDWCGRYCPMDLSWQVDRLHAALDNLLRHHNANCKAGNRCEFTRQSVAALEETGANR